jgi:ribosomal-protein-alanine N-acetyltransferase
MKLLPIEKELEDNAKFASDTLCMETLPMTIDFFKRIGYVPPWIGYFAQLNGKIVGSAAFKGQPINGKVEIAYGTMEPFQNQGIGTKICRALAELSLKTDPSVKITARTLPENNYSTKVLKKNNFVWLGTVYDPEDGIVWEWEYRA